MSERAVQQLLQPLLAGAVCGFLVSVPVGPVNLTVINQALRRGFGPAFLLGLGAISGELCYAVLLLWGHSTILEQPALLWAMRVLAVAVIAGLGVSYLRFKPERLQASEATVEKVDARWRHPRSFFLGFALAISNLMLLVVWATLVTLLFAHEWVVPHWSSRLLCAGGILAGGATWFLLLSFFVSRAHRRVKPATLAVLVRGCGVVFVLFAGLLAWRLVRGRL
jgi:L-lysine exporter family protein LysE/ArgO